MIFFLFLGHVSASNYIFVENSINVQIFLKISKTFNYSSTCHENFRNIFFYILKKYTNQIDILFAYIFPNYLQINENTIQIILLVFNTHIELSDEYWINYEYFHTIFLFSGHVSASNYSFVKTFIKAQIFKKIS